jgi:hypothetical protein
MLELEREISLLPSLVRNDTKSKPEVISVHPPRMIKDYRLMAGK